MSQGCASCGAAMASTDTACPSCGQKRAPSRAAVSKSDDALQYVKIIGILVAVVLVVLIAAGMMGKGPVTCLECNGKKVVACSNCVSGRNLCKVCKGAGHDPGTFSTCLECKGKGDTVSCYKCGGRPSKSCVTCKGTGLQPE
jgi:hypothetical protein